MKTLRFIASALFAAAVALPGPAQARTKLVTLPGRDAMLVNLEHPSYSLLSEERDITLQQGTNHIDFSWQGVSIDRDSIQLQLLGHPGDGPEATKIVNVAFPPNEDALTWRIYSPEARTERIRVSYLLYGIGRQFGYEFTVNPEETQAVFQQYFQMSNGSGEDLDDTAIRIHRSDDWTRSVESGETRRFLAFENRELPIRKVYVARPQPYSTRGEEGEIISLVYEIDNDEASGIGEFLLRGGKSRIYSEDPDGTTIFIGEDNLEETASGETAELALGTVKDVLLKRHVMADRRENERRNTSRKTVLFDRVVEVRYEIENCNDKAAAVRVLETIPADAVIEEVTAGNATYERKSGSELELEIDLPARAADSEEVEVVEVRLRYRQPNVVAN